jgi:hypothetical protein
MAWKIPTLTSLSQIVVASKSTRAKDDRASPGASIDLISGSLDNLVDVWSETGFYVVPSIYMSVDHSTRHDYAHH